MKMTGDETITKCLNIHDSKLIKKSIHNGYVIDSKSSKDKIVLTKVIRRIQQQKITYDNNQRILEKNQISNQF